MSSSESTVKLPSHYPIFQSLTHITETSLQTCSTFTLLLSLELTLLTKLLFFRLNPSSSRTTPALSKASSSLSLISIFSSRTLLFLIWNYQTAEFSLLLTHFRGSFIFKISVFPIYPTPKFLNYSLLQLKLKQLFPFPVSLSKTRHSKTLSFTSKVPSA